MVPYANKRQNEPNGAKRNIKEKWEKAKEWKKKISNRACACLWNIMRNTIRHFIMFHINVNREHIHTYDDTYSCSNRCFCCRETQRFDTSNCFSFWRSDKFPYFNAIIQITLYYYWQYRVSFLSALLFYFIFHCFFLSSLPFRFSFALKFLNFCSFILFITLAIAFYCV